MGFNLAFKGLIKNPVMVLENLRERDHLEDLGVERRIILKWVRASVGTAWIGLE